VKFKLDENMPADLATHLREARHEVADVMEEGLAGEDDQPVLAAATAEGRILLTFDLDFANVRRYAPGTHAGIVVFRLHDRARHLPVNDLHQWAGGRRSRSRRDGSEAYPVSTRPPGWRGA
jgi:predicted nuclease of predicted toxin-antitoxin system